jgi:hypothetical protein
MRLVHPWDAVLGICSSSGSSAYPETVLWVNSIYLFHLPRKLPEAADSAGSSVSASGFWEAADSAGSSVSVSDSSVSAVFSSARACAASASSVGTS